MALSPLDGPTALPTINDGTTERSRRGTTKTSNRATERDDSVLGSGGNWKLLLLAFYAAAYCTLMSDPSILGAGEIAE